MIYRDNEPCNAFASVPDKVYAVYNEEIKCIGFHEDSHLLSYIINRPNTQFIREGLAMYFDKVWWGISNFEWTKYYIKKDENINICELFDNNTFYNSNCAFSYPIAGAFTEYIINLYGFDSFIEIYKEKDGKEGIEKILNTSVDDL